MAQMEPFDRKARQRARDRAAGLIAGREQMLWHVADELAERRQLRGAAPQGPELWIGLMLPPPGVTGLDPSPRLAAAHGGVAGEEDQRHFADGQFASITAFMTLHGVNDLPGALLLCRRALRPGGRFQAAFPAGFSLGAVRDAFLEADVAAGGGVSPRVGPTVDPAEAAGLLQRAGFVEPVAEVDTLTLRYQSLTDLARDVRAHGDSGWLASRGRGLTTPRRWAAAEAAFAREAAADGRVGVEVQILYLSAVAP
ncbi:class I SAM-dependent methyltransferase [Sandaracinobacter neustonicus]|uniref:Class I SAM-dependent methyltransferase n=1 Tax=Sandaracinobacter neustonicus TaxID=1715348 RepID=A0A501XDZ8_9SPHN|nr:methyltransferase domain-containing protein [Sandaracinobacter neustonicus]TPE58537.1 class I SAM-dependent methyltransferase [Sandaracinobacter neustonicus]